MNLHDVAFSNGTARLAAVLALPEGEGPFPAVAFVAGSGAVERHDPYFVALATCFAEVGFASLMWDKPGIGNSTGDLRKQTLQDRAEEALAAVKLLKSRDEIQSDAVGLWGISQGGLVAPLAASQAGEIAFMVLVSAPGITPAEQELFRVAHTLRAEGFAEEDGERALSLYSSALQMLREDRSFDDIVSTLGSEEVLKSPWLKYVTNLDPADAEFLRGIMDFNPSPVLQNVACPLLGIWGEADPVVPVFQSFEVFRQALLAAGNNDITFKIFAEADHMILASRPESIEAEQKDGFSFAPGYIELMQNWLAGRLGASSDADYYQPLDMRA